MDTDEQLVPDGKGVGMTEDYLKKHFPLSFQAIERLMRDHGAPKRGGDDQEWRTHNFQHHLDHAAEHFDDYDKGKRKDKDSGMHPLVHVACRDLMALEVYLGGGVKPLIVIGEGEPCPKCSKPLSNGGVYVSPLCVDCDGDK